MNMPVTVWSSGDPQRRRQAPISWGSSMIWDTGPACTQSPIITSSPTSATRAPRSRSVRGKGGAPTSLPVDFLRPLLSCQSADEPGTNNWAGLCDPHVDSLASQAQAAPLTDPAAARRLWAQADHIVTDQAPYVQVLNGSDAGAVSSRVGNYQGSPCTDRCSIRCGFDSEHF
jgi:ABC-type transport system substrate-binding protein